MSVVYKHARITRASLDTLAGNSQLEIGQLFLITDEDRIAICLTSSTYETFSKESEALTPTIINKIRINRSTRWYLYADGRWISGSDDNYGVSHVNTNEGATTGTNPIHEWETQGEFVKAGNVIKTINVIGRINNITDILDVEMYFVMRHPNNTDIWGTAFQGIDNDSEQTIIPIHRDMWKTPTGLGPLGSGAGLPIVGNLNDQFRRIYDINYTVPQDGWFDILIRPVRTGTSTSTRYMYTTISIDMEI